MEVRTTGSGSPDRSRTFAASSGLRVEHPRFIETVTVRRSSWSAGPRVQSAREHVKPSPAPSSSTSSTESKVSSSYNRR